jgi:hypothetical protein
MEDRMFLQEIWNDYNRWDIQQMIDSKKIIIEETIVGFIK